MAIRRKSHRALNGCGASARRALLDVAARYLAWRVGHHTRAVDRETLAAIETGAKALRRLMRRARLRRGARVRSARYSRRNDHVSVKDTSDFPKVDAFRLPFFRGPISWRGC